MKKEQIKIISKLFNILKNGCILLQALAFFYAFCSVLFWFLQLNNAPFIGPVEPFFTPVYDYIQTLYKQPEASAAKINLVGIVTSICFIVIGILIRSAKDYITEIEEAFNLQVIKKKRENDLREQRQTQKEYLEEMKKHKKIIILLELKIEAITNYLSGDLVNKDKLLEIREEIINNLNTNIKAHFIYETVILDQSSIYIISETTKALECITLIKNVLQEAIEQYDTSLINIDKSIVLNILSGKLNLSKEIIFLKKLSQLRYTNTIISTSLFKNCFELINPYKIKFTDLGNFQFFINGQVKNYEIFSIKI